MSEKKREVLKWDERFKHNIEIDADMKCEAGITESEKWTALKNRIHRLPDPTEKIKEIDGCLPGSSFKKGLLSLRTKYSIEGTTKIIGDKLLSIKSADEKLEYLLGEQERILLYGFKTRVLEEFPQPRFSDPFIDQGKYEALLEKEIQARMESPEKWINSLIENTKQRQKSNVDTNNAEKLFSIKQKEIMLHIFNISGEVEIMEINDIDEWINGQKKISWKSRPCDLACFVDFMRDKGLLFWAGKPHDIAEDYFTVAGRKSEIPLRTALNKAYNRAKENGRLDRYKEALDIKLKKNPPND